MTAVGGTQASTRLNAIPRLGDARKILGHPHAYCGQMKESGVAGVQELQNETAFRPVDDD